MTIVIVTKIVTNHKLSQKLSQKVFNDEPSMTRDKIIFVTEGLISCTLTTSYGYRARLVLYPKIATLTTLADVVPGASYSQHKHPKSPWCIQVHVLHGFILFWSF